ncbi:MAG TPA: glycogen synthase [Longimicrobiales bacterium]|nr:glycogen synthase [Longimicrobiales bacterium]
MRILFASAEANPYWKTGGLADVARSLPDALVERGHDVRVILPFYRPVRDRGFPLEESAVLDVPWPGDAVPTRFLLHRPPHGAPGVLVEGPDFFDTDDPYGAPFGDVLALGRRFAFFCRAVVAYAKVWGADIVHLNDWPTGLVPVYGLVDGLEAGTVFAIHNLPYQGNFPPALVPQIGAPWGLYRPENGFEFWGQASFMKAGLALSARLVTVSPTYGAEIRTPDFGAGLDGLLRFRHGVLHGILNGIEPRVWDPAHDGALTRPFGPEQVGLKEENRAALLAELGLTGDGPLFVAVTRLAYQKGIDLILGAIWQIVESGASVAVLGSGDAGYEWTLGSMAGAAPHRVAVRFGFDDGLARRLYAGGDFFLMPSRYEPCGLGQMIAQRYGTPPVVRHTGGLVDTVVDGVTGFAFHDASPAGLLSAVDRARRAWHDGSVEAIRRRCMELDWSWERSAAEYEEVYACARAPAGG